MIKQLFSIFFEFQKSIIEQNIEIKNLICRLASVSSMKYAKKFYKKNKEIAYSIVRPNYETIKELLEEEIYKKTVGKLKKGKLNYRNK